ncbi:extracellular solute-binding protein [Wolinella succinogenes]|nr:extracellular solute-binding protein [Wolinella succinogenes]VEG81916.1 Oligopeptide-binding protein AppA precursor [Wolinella succinogenes]HCZ19322.1 ABC transporter substrate-binding protein [Helicobacter sp.]
MKGFSWGVLWLFLCAGGLEFAFASTFSDKGFSLSGEVKYKELKYFDYVNPEAPKGGAIKRYEIGGFDTLNAFALKGTPADGLELLYDTLTVHSEDEPFSEYGLVAERIQRAKDNSFVIFHLNKNARFHDGNPITAFDVEFSFNTLIGTGNPAIKRYYEDVKEVVVVDKYTVKFNFSNKENRELPLILGQLRILPKHFYENRPFGENPLEIPLGSGPYRILSFETGKEIVYERVKDYWAQKHPTRLGYFNFDRVAYEYYKDETVALEAFKAGAYDFRQESAAKTWALGYEGEPLKKKQIIKEEIAHSLPSGMQGYFFNTRRDLFKDIRVREALSYAFDFEWSNKNLFFGQYTRTKSFFDNSELASFGTPSPQEREWLTPFKEQLPEGIFDQPFTLPTTKGDGNIRPQLKRAQQLLKEAGYEIKNKKLIHTTTGQPFVFELLLLSPAMERVALPFKRNLATLGIEMKIRTIDLTQYINRLREFDYDMIVGVIGQSLSPGNEQRYYWHSSSKDERGSKNYAGIDHPAVDRLVEMVVNAKDRRELVDYTRALDRVLLWNHYVIPHFHNRTFRVAHWNRFSRPNISPLYGLGFWTWWVDPQKEEELLKARPALKRR